MGRGGWVHSGSGRNMESVSDGWAGPPKTTDCRRPAVAGGCWLSLVGGEKGVIAYPLWYVCTQNVASLPWLPAGRLLWRPASVLRSPQLQSPNVSKIPDGPCEVDFCTRR